METIKQYILILVLAFLSLGSSAKNINIKVTEIQAQGENVRAVSATIDADSKDLIIAWKKYLRTEQNVKTGWIKKKKNKRTLIAESGSLYGSTEKDFILYSQIEMSKEKKSIISLAIIPEQETSPEADFTKEMEANTINLLEKFLMEYERNHFHKRFVLAKNAYLLNKDKKQNLEAKEDKILIAIENGKNKKRMIRKLKKVRENLHLVDQDLAKHREDLQELIYSEDSIY